MGVLYLLLSCIRIYMERAYYFIATKLGYKQLENKVPAKVGEIPPVPFASSFEPAMPKIQRVPPPTVFGYYYSTEELNAIIKEQETEYNSLADHHNALYEVYLKQKTHMT